MPTLPTDLKDQSVRQVILLTAYWLFTNDFHFVMVAVRERPVEKVGRPHWEWSNHPTLSRSTRCCREADTTENEMTILYLKKLLLVRVATNQQERSNYLVLREELQRSCEAGLESWFWKNLLFIWLFFLNTYHFPASYHSHYDYIWLSEFATESL